MGPEQETRPQLQILSDMKAVSDCRIGVRIVCLSYDPLIKSVILVLILCTIDLSGIASTNISITKSTAQKSARAAALSHCGVGAVACSLLLFIIN